MRDAREIIRLKASSVSTHEIARRLGMATDVALPPASFTPRSSPNEYLLRGLSEV
jgi:hypothetical protein